MSQLWKWLPMALCAAALIALAAPAALAVPALQLYGSDAAATLDSGASLGSPTGISTLGLTTRISAPQAPGINANVGPASIGDTGFRRGRANLRRWYNNPPNDVPEPGTLWLLGFGVAGIVLASRRARKQ